MAKAQLKLLLFLIVLGVTLGSMAAAYYIYDKILSPEKRIKEEFVNLKKGDAPLVDPGEKRFEAAVDLIKKGRIEDGRDGLFKLIQQFPDSPTCVEAKRIIGEINMDQLFAAESKIGKKDYIVQPGQGLELIANKQGTTVDMLIRLNGLMSTVLQPGDHLTILPVDFSLSVDVSAKTVTLMRKVGEKELFFKEYLASEIRLPRSIRLPAEMTIKGKSVTVDGKAIQPPDPRYVNADKRLPAGRGVRPEVLLRTLPPVKAVPVVEKPAKKDGVEPLVGVEEDEEQGIFLAAEDLEEMFVLVRNGSKLYLIR